MQFATIDSAVQLMQLNGSKFFQINHFGTTKSASGLVGDESQDVATALRVWFEHLPPGRYTVIHGQTKNGKYQNIDVLYNPDGNANANTVSGPAIGQLPAGFGQLPELYSGKYEAQIAGMEERFKLQLEMQDLRRRLEDAERAAKSGLAGLLTEIVKNPEAINSIAGIVQSALKPNTPALGNPHTPPQPPRPMPQPTQHQPTANGQELQARLTNALSQLVAKLGEETTVRALEKLAAKEEHVLKNLLKML